jgi:hypothetical protein
MKNPPSIGSGGPRLCAKQEPHNSPAAVDPFAKDKSLFARSQIGTEVLSVVASTNPENETVIGMLKQFPRFLLSLEMQLVVLAGNTDGKGELNTQQHSSLPQQHAISTP